MPGYCRRLLLVPVLLLGPTACTTGSPAPPGMMGAAAPPGTPTTTLAGEVITGGACPVLLARWLSAADRNHDGALEQEEAIEDGAAFFARIDTNGDHFLMPAELAAYRDAQAPTAYLDRAVRESHHQAEDSEGGKRKGGSPAFTSTIGLRGQPDPIMAADANLDFKVSADELRAKIAARFAHLDQDHDSRLTPAELAAECPPD